MPMKDSIQPRRLFSYLLIAAIGFIFVVQFGPASRGCDSTVGGRTDTAIARVNGKEIPMQDFRRVYQDQVSAARAQQIPESMVRQFIVPQLMDRLVEGELWMQAAERHGITASDEEIRKIIRADQSFYENGKFSTARYSQVVRDYLQKTVPEYEHQLRRELSARKMAQLVANGALVSEDEVKTGFQQEGNKANVTFARFLPAMYADQVPAATPAQLEAYQKDHPKEIADYYEANRALYEQAERIHARHILVSVPREAPADQKEAAKKKAETIRAELEGGKDFAAAASQYSDDASNKNQGGDLGTHSRESAGWVKEFTDAAFAVEAGKVSAPVETPFGVHLIKVDQRFPSQKQELKDVQAEIARTLLQREGAKQMARAEADKALAALKAGKSIATLFPPEGGTPAATRFETEKKPEAVPTGEFTASAQSLPFLGSSPTLLSAVFATQQPQALDAVYEAGEGFAIAEVTSRTLPSDAEFAKQKETLLSEARRAKGIELQNGFMKALRKDAQIVTNDQAVSTLLDS